MAKKGEETKVPEGKKFSVVDVSVVEGDRKYEVLREDGEKIVVPGYMLDILDFFLGIR